MPAVLMAIFLRKIDARSLWHNPLPGEDWLGERDLRADALRDLRTDENKLSIFEVNEEAGISVTRIVAAIAAKRDFLAKLDFILFESDLLQNLDISSKKVDGDTLDPAVNASHIDLVRLTAAKLAKFGARIRVDGKIERRAEKQVVRLIKESLAQGFINPGDLKPGVAKHVIV